MPGSLPGFPAAALPRAGACTAGGFGTTSLSAGLFTLHARWRRLSASANSPQRCGQRHPRQTLPGGNAAGQGCPGTYARCTAGFPAPCVRGSPRSPPRRRCSPRSARAPPAALPGGAATSRTALRGLPAAPHPLRTRPRRRLPRLAASPRGHTRV